MQDLAERVAALGGRVDNLDDHWTVDFAREGDKVVHTLRGKHSRAQEVSPISITVTGRAGLDPGLDDTVVRAFGFGTSDEVVLPPEAVEALTIAGPEWLTTTFRNAEVQLRPNGLAPHAGAAAELVLLDRGRKVTASYSGRVHGLGQGTLGRSVDVDLPGGSLRLLIPHDGNARAKFQLTTSLDNVEPATALRIFRLSQQLLASETFEVKVNGKTASGGNTPHMPAVEIERWEQIRLYVEDLAVLQQHSEQYFPIPIDLNVEDRIALRVARLLIDGHTVISPLHRVLTCTLNGNDSPSLRDALTQEPRGIRAATELTLTLAERTFNLGPAQFSHPRAAAVNARHATEALDTGDAEGTQIEFRPADGEHFRFHLLSSPEQQPLTPVPLGLPGYREPS